VDGAIGHDLAAGVMTATSPFHEGEQRVQERLGVREAIEPWARKVVRPFLPEEHRAFYGQLPFVVVAARDARGRPWATLLAGRPGFLTSPEPVSLVSRALPGAGDALAGALSPGADVGLLGIELATRRRNRVNGRVGAVDDAGFTLAVDQSFGNCPQYIHERRWRLEPAAASSSGHRHDALDARLRAWIERADTFFIATGHRGDGESPTFGMDASHRGGAPGFVRVDDGRHLVFPDYAGNNHYNTLGNLLLDARAGLVFVDFERGNLLQLTGRATIEWGASDLERFPGARRMLAFELDEAVDVQGALPLRWDAPAGSVRSLRVVEKRRESDDVTSFSLESRDGGPLPGFSAGQHLPLEVELSGHEAAASRTYSLSNAPGDGRYRITVKREPQGRVSRHLHDNVETGGILDARTPAGEFVLHETGDRPVVLVSAGVGLTPLVSMLHALVAEPRRRRVWFVHGARDGRHHPLADEVRRLADSAPHVTLHVAYSRPQPDDVSKRRFDTRGRIDGALLQSLVPDLAGDYYLCGPAAFMAAVQDDLEQRGVTPERIHSESFGPCC
jgi:ferredoxin-NADP reductase/predicted pyridoxine 5'-phosphate oxidase superfamily flavin-nucleotide-binding protein